MHLLVFHFLLLLNLLDFNSNILVLLNSSSQLLQLFLSLHQVSLSPQLLVSQSLLEVLTHNFLLLLHLEVFLLQTPQLHREIIYFFSFSLNLFVDVLRLCHFRCEMRTLLVFALLYFDFAFEKFDFFLLLLIFVHDLFLNLFHFLEFLIIQTQLLFKFLVLALVLFTLHNQILIVLISLFQVFIQLNYSSLPSPQLLQLSIHFINIFL